MIDKMNDYQILKSIGVGSYGTVHLALHKQEQCHYVVKRLKMWGLKEEQKQKIDNEVKLLRDFQHVNIVRYRDSFIDKEGYLNIVMTNCEGGDMYQLVENSGGKKIPEKQIIDWAVQIALAIYYMHQKKILHRDLKTSNIFLNNNRVRLGDFGISKVLDQKNDFLAQTNIGTPLYMSPQQFKNKPYSYKSDIWALGCVLYEMCNQKHAFTANSLQGLARKIFMGQFSPVSDFYSQQLRQLIHKMLSQNPKGRPTIIEILQKPFMRRRVQTYIKEIMTEGKNDQQLVQKLIQQGKSLGIRIQLSTQRDSESTPRKTSANKNKRRQSQEKLKKQRQRIKQELQIKLKKQNDQKKKMQEKIKEIQKQRKEMQQAAKNKRKNSYDRVNSASGRNSTSSFNQKKDNSVSGSTQQHTPSVSSKSSKKQNPIAIPIKPVSDLNTKTALKKQQSLANETKKPFQMKEEHDMHYEDQQSEEQDGTFINAIIDQEVEQQEEAKLKLFEQKSNKPNIKEKPKQESLEQSIRQEIFPSNSFVSPQELGKKQRQNIKKQYQQQQQMSIRESIKPQIQVPIQKVTQSSHKPLIDETRIRQIEQLKKEVKQKTAHINLLETELQAIDFEFSSDSQNQPNFGQQKRQNPTYIRVKQRSNDLKHKIIAKLGREGYNKLMKYAYSHIGKQNQKTKQEISAIVGKQLIGLWHLASRIVAIQKVAETIPQYF